MIGSLTIYTDLRIDTPVTKAISNLLHLTELDLSRNLIGIGGCECISKNIKIKKLKLNESGIDDTGIGFLS